VAVVLVVGSLVKFLPYDSMNNDIKKDNLYTKLMDTQQQKTEIANKDYSLTEKKQSNFSPKQRLDEKKQSNFSSNETQRKTTHYTEEELQYLEQYIKEDGYELIANR
jgi:FKBP-type peptidyl-prolyl cis-trans isomerase